MNSIALGPWILGACIVIALVLIAIGAGMAVTAMSATKRRAEALMPGELLAKAALAQANAERLQQTLTDIEASVPRVTAALAAISASLHALKLAFSFRR